MSVLRGLHRFPKTRSFQITRVVQGAGEVCASSSATRFSPNQFATGEPHQVLTLRSEICIGRFFFPPWHHLEGPFAFSPSPFPPESEGIELGPADLIEKEIESLRRLVSDPAVRRSFLRDTRSAEEWDLIEHPLGEVCRSEMGESIRLLEPRSATAELRPDQRDTDSLPPYELLDRVLARFIEGRASVDDLVRDGLPRDVVMATRSLLDRNEYKRRQAPPILRVTPRSFGPGRRLPIARGGFGEGG